jgi:hypothetical protein
VSTHMQLFDPDIAASAGPPTDMDVTYGVWLEALIDVQRCANPERYIAVLWHIPP